MRHINITHVRFLGRTTSYGRKTRIRSCVKVGQDRSGSVRAREDRWFQEGTGRVFGRDDWATKGGTPFPLPPFTFTFTFKYMGSVLTWWIFPPLFYFLFLAYFCVGGISADVIDESGWWFTCKEWRTPRYCYLRIGHCSSLIPWYCAAPTSVENLLDSLLVARYLILTHFLTYDLMVKRSQRSLSNPW